MRPRTIIRGLFWALCFVTTATAGFEVCPVWSRKPETPIAESQSNVANDKAQYQLFASNYTYHWRPSEEHRRVYALSLSKLLPDDRFCGLSLFRNSFGQPSGYVFTGKAWRGFWSAVPQLSASVSAGILYGYTGEYQEKVPLNVEGFSPAIIPSIRFEISPRVMLEAHVLGTAGLMVGASARFF